MGRIVTLASGKGGVGKTTVTSNLGSVLNEFGRKTLVFDGNITAPNLSMHLGIPLYPITLHDVLRGDAHIREAIYDHPTGLSVVPGGISVDDIGDINIEKLSDSLDNISNEAEIILLDAPAGLGKESLKSMEVADDILLVTNPDLPSVTEALKVKEMGERIGKNVLGVVVNRVKGKNSELSSEEIEDMLDLPILSKVPEDSKIPQSINKRTPLLYLHPNSPASREFKRLGADLVGEDVRTEYGGLFQKIMDWLRS